jgi:hypothetical protein
MTKSRKMRWAVYVARIAARENIAVYNILENVKGKYHLRDKGVDGHY